MKLSIVIPVYNVEKYIRECVDSVLNQTMKDYELIIVDDGSKDSSGAILDEYQVKDSRVTVIHKENGGVSAARNDALQKCTGDYIYIMDSDDYLEPNALQVMYEEAVRTDADVVITDHSKFINQNDQKPCRFFQHDFVTEDKEVILQLQKMVLHKGYSPYPTEENYGVGMGAPWTKLIKSELIYHNHLQFDSYVRGVFDDGLFSLAVFEFANKVAYKGIITYHFRILSSSLTHRFRANQLEVNSRIFEKIRQFGEDHNKGEDFYKAYYARVMSYCMISFDNYFFNKKYQGGKRQNYQEFQKTIKSETYRTAIDKVDLNILSKRVRRIAVFMRLHLGWLLWLLYTIKLSKQ